jgi:hypothetical protein
LGIPHHRRDDSLRLTNGFDPRRQLIQTIRCEVMMELSSQ